MPGKISKSSNGWRKSPAATTRASHPLTQATKLVKRLEENKVKLGKLRDDMRSDFEEFEGLMESVDTASDEFEYALENLNFAIDTLSQYV